MLRTEHLKKVYTSHVAVHDLSLTVPPGKIVGLLGPNGAGKTTGFYLIVGLIRPTEGKVFLDEKDISHLTMAHRARAGLGYLPQEASIFRGLSVKDNILAVLELKKLEEHERRSQLDTILSQLGLTAIQERLGVQLSGGERRRVEIGRLLAQRPRYALLDEPFAGVDPISVSELQLLIRFLADEGIGILITDHNVRETLSICDQGYIVHQGAVIAEGSPNEVMNNARVRATYLGEDFSL